MPDKPEFHFNSFPNGIFDEYHMTEYFVVRPDYNIRMHTTDVEAARAYAKEYNYELLKVVSTRSIEKL